MIAPWIPDPFPASSRWAVSPLVLIGALAASVSGSAGPLPAPASAALAGFFGAGLVVLVAGFVDWARVEVDESTTPTASRAKRTARARRRMREGFTFHHPSFRVSRGSRRASLARPQARH